MRNSRTSVPSFPKVQSAHKSTFYFSNGPGAHIQQNNNTLGDVNQRVNLICLEFHWLCFFSVLISCFLSFLPKKQEGLEQSRWKKNIKLEARKIVSGFDRVSLDELLGQPLSCQRAKRESKSGNRFQLCQNCCDTDEIANAYLKFF